MSRFYAEIQGSSGTATRTGSEGSGISGHIRGWHLGAYVRMSVNKDGEDQLSVSITGGSLDPSTIGGRTHFVIKKGKVRRVKNG